ncbi:transmembrane protein 232-like isoform X1 [Clytia hemisphaerica]|uniref:Uncharacterized protein n=2 Tax=Clytia hemisphaerica TaxID=252671 RepID=A0A7M5WUJ2_9CNID
MPIAKVPVIHKFGIISRTHQESIKQRILEREAGKIPGFISRIPRSSSAPETSMITSHESLEEVIFQLQNEKEELVLMHHEKVAKEILKKIKFKLTSIEKKDIVQTLQICWRELAMLISCNHCRIVEESLNLLKVSMIISPLSKQIIPSLLDVSLAIQQALLLMDSADISTKEHSLNELLAETSFYVFVRVFYHHMASDLEQLPGSHQMEGLYLINKGLSKLLVQYEEKPTIWMYMNATNHIVSQISKSSAHKVEDFISNLEKVEQNAPKSDDSHPPNESAKEGNDTRKNSISTLLWNTLCVWKSLSRQNKLSKHVLDDIKSFDFSTITTKHQHWMEVVISIFILSECAKVKMEYLSLLVAIGPQAILRKKSEMTWSTTLQFFYLRALADVGLHGLTTDIITQALLGDRNKDGLANFLQRSGDDKCSCGVRYLAHQYLHDIYLRYKKDSLKEAVRNALWETLEKFRDKEKNPLVLCINKSEEKESSISLENLVLKKISTNLSIIYLPLENDKRRKTPKKERKCLPNKTGVKESPRHNVKPKINSRSSTDHVSSSSGEEAWLNMQCIASDQYGAENHQTEEKVMEIRNNLRDMGLDIKETLELPVTATLPDPQDISLHKFDKPDKSWYE